MVHKSGVSPRLFFIIPFIIALMSCTDFFTNSLAKWAARDPKNLVPAVDAGNVGDIVAKFEKDPDGSLVVLDRIKDALAGAEGEDRTALQEAALAAAANAVDLTGALASALSDPSALTDVETAKNAALDAFNALKNLDAVGTALAGIIPSDSGGFAKFAESAPPGDMALAAVILLAGEAKRQSGDDMEGYISSFEAKEKTAAEKLAVDMAQAALDRGDEVDGPLADILKGLKLTA